MPGWKAKLLLILATFDKPATAADLITRSISVGLAPSSSALVTSTLRRCVGLAIKLPQGWELSRNGWSYVNANGFSEIFSHDHVLSSDLRAHLDAVSDPQLAAFMKEAISCYEAKLFRSAIVMGWVAAVFCLQKHIVESNLLAFNEAARSLNSKWKSAVDADGLSLMKERDFVICCFSISVLSKPQKDRLLAALDLRNACGHPNSLLVSERVTAAHLETLLLGVFKRFGVKKS